MAIALSVNLNKIALIRNSRQHNEPDLLFFAKEALKAGADGLTLHPRPDLRHSLPQDAYDISAIEKVEFNLEGNPLIMPSDDYPGYLEIARQSKPAQCTLVPDEEDQLTSDSGWDLARYAKKLAPIIEELKDLGARVSLFMDYRSKDFKMAKSLGADRIELYTEPLVRAIGTKEQEAVWRQFEEAAHLAYSCQLGLNAGHDLNLINLPLVKKLPYLQEVSIGHALVSDAILKGWVATVAAYKALLQ